MKNIDTTLASVILLAMKTREESYDKVASDAATAEEDKKREAAPDDMKYLYCVDYSQFYKLTMQQAAEKAADQLNAGDVGYPVYLLLEYTWNDAEIWAREVLNVV